MPNETRDAIAWALRQSVETPAGLVQITPDLHHELVDKVGEYFNNNNIEYNTFSYVDLVPYFD